jgi:hypothetical protein
MSFTQGLTLCLRSGLWPGSIRPPRRFRTARAFAAFAALPAPAGRTRLAQSLFAAIARDLEQKGACVRKGTLIDATVIGSASKGDKEAAWAKHSPGAWL